MMRLQSSGWKMSKLFAGSTRGPFSENGANQMVRIFSAASRSPITHIEIRLDASRRQTGAVSVSRLVKAVATDLYAEELHKGAGVLDIGLFGGRLFDHDVLRELKAGDGVLWEIRSQRETP